MENSDQRQPFVAERPKKGKCKQLLLPLIFVSAIAICWALAAQFTKRALRHDFHAPYFLVWFNTNFLLLCFPFYLLLSISTSWEETKKIIFEPFKKSNGELSLLNLLFKVLMMLMFWMAANVPFSYGLTHISASAATSIISSNVVAVWILSWFFLKETFNWGKLISVVISCVGVILVSMDKNYAGNAYGVTAVLMAALSAALYKVIFKKLIGNVGLGPVSLFLSLIGLANLTVNAIPTTIIVYFNVEEVTFANIPWYPLVTSALLSVSYNLLVNVSIALLDPLIVSIGALLGIPLNAIIDMAINNLKMELLFGCGTSLILISLAICFYLDQRKRFRKTKVEEIEA